MTATPRCKICKRPLKKGRSIAQGVGPECAQKFASMLVGAGLTVEALNIPIHIAADRAVGRYLHLAVQALLAGSTRDVERFKVAAKEAAGRAERAAAKDSGGDCRGTPEYTVGTESPAIVPGEGGFALAV